MKALKEILNRRVRSQGLSPLVFGPWCLLFLIFIIFTFSSSAYADVSTQILLPDAVGASNAWDKQADPGVTFINNDTDTQADSWRSNTEGQLMHVDVADWTLPGSNVVLKVRVNVRAQTAGNENINIGLDNGGTTSDTGSGAGGGATTGSFAISASPTWTDYWEEWDSPPGGSWNLNNLRVRVLHDNIGGASYNYVTKTWITIYYADVSAGYVLIRVRQGGGGDSTTIQGGVDLTQGTFTYPHIIEVQDSNTYNETATISGKTTSSTNTLTLRAQAGQTPLLDFGANLSGITITGVNYVIIKDLRLKGCSGAASAVIRLNNSDNTKVQNCTIYDFEDIAVDVDNGSDSFEITNSIIYNGSVGENGTGAGIFGGDNVASLNGVVRNCTFYNIGPDSDTLGADATGTTGAVVLQNSSSGWTVTNSIIWIISNQSDPAVLGLTISDAGSQTGFTSNYNVFYRTGSGGAYIGVWDGSGRIDLPTWQSFSVKDPNSKEDNPQFVNPGTDFHEKSTFGTYNAGSWDKYNVDSPAIDLGNTTDTYSTETEDNGNRINAGVYGNTSQASLSGVLTGGGNDDTVTTWTGKAGTTSWNTDNNWSQKSVPTSTDNVYIPDRTYDPVLDVTTTVNTLTISNYSNNSPAQTNGTLTLNNSSYNLTINNNFTVESGTTYNQSAGTLYVKGNFSNSGVFNHTGGTVELNGTGNQSITTDGDNFYNLTINNTGVGGTSVSTTSAINVTNDLTLQAANSFDLGAGTHTVTRDFLQSGSAVSMTGTLNIKRHFTKTTGTFAPGAGTVAFNGTSSQTITPGGATFNHLTINNTGSTATVTTAAALTVNGNFTLTAGTLDLSSYTHTITDNVADTFNINGGTLKISTSTLTTVAKLNVGTSGTLNMTGAGTLKLPTVGADVKGKFAALASSGTPKVTTSGTEGTDRYAFIINGTSSSNKAEVDIFGLKFYSPDVDGLKIGASGADYVTVTRIDQMDFQKGISGGSGTVYMNLWKTSGTYTFKLNKFNESCKNNVGLMNGGAGSTANITMENGQGVKGDNITGGTDTWTGESEDLDPDSDTHITWKYFKRWTGEVNTVWSNGANWEGGVAPKDCLQSTYDDVLIGSAPNNPMLDADSCANEVQITSGGKLSLSTKTLTITGSTYRADDGTFEPGSGTVKFSGTAVQTVNNALNPFYNLEVDKTGGTVNLGANLTVNGAVTLTNGTINLNGNLMTISGNVTSNPGTSIQLPTTSSLTLSGGTISGSLTLSGTSSLTTSGALTLASTVTLSDSATLTNSSTLSISSTFNLQGTSTLTANGAVTVTGTFNASGTGPTVSGTGSFTVDAAAVSVNISKLTFSNTSNNGLTINDGSKISALNNVTFSQTRSVTQRHLYVGGAVGTKTFAGLYFATVSGGKNVVTPPGGSGSIVMSDYSGPGAGASNDDDLGASVTWQQAKVWAGNYTYKLQLTVTNNSGASALPTGAAVEYQFDHNAMLVTNCNQADGNDFRIFYNDANSSHPTSPGLIKELDRVILNKNHTTGWNTTNTVIAFATQEQIAASGTSDEYWVVCGNATVTSPPANAANAGVIFFDGFESGDYTTGGWNTHGNNIVVTTARKKSGSYAAGAELSVAFQSPSGFDKTISLSGYSNVYMFYERSTEDLGSGNVGYEAAYTSGTETVLETNSNAGTTAFTLRNYSIPNTATSIRISTLFSGALPLGTDGLYDDIRVYANQNGSVGTVACTGGCTWVDIKNKFSEWANFSPQGVPSSNDAVYINGSTVYKPIVDASFSNTILSLIVNDTANTSADADEILFSNNLTVTRDVTLVTGTTETLGANTVNLGGNWSATAPFNGGTNTLTGTVNFNGGATQSITGTTTFNNLQTAIANTKVTVDTSATTISGTTTVAASTEVEISTGKTLKITGSTVTVNGTLDVDAGATLDLADATSLTVGGGATFEAVGTSSNRAAITSSDTGQASGYTFTVSGTGTMNASYFNFYYSGPCGLQISSSTAITSLSNGKFDRPSTTACAGGESFLLDFNGYTYGTPQSLSYNDFKLTGSGLAKSVRGGAGAGQHGVITLSNATGSYSETDPNTLITWPSLVTPDMTSAVAVDDSGGGAGIQYGDTVTITFNEATNGYDISGSINTILDLPGAKTWGSIVSAVWSSAAKTNDTIKITLGSGADIAVNDSITAGGSCPNSICDVTNANLATCSPPNITGTFGANTPDMISAEANDGVVTQVGIDNDDKVVLKFNTATNGSAFNVTAANIDTVLQLNNSHTWKDGSGAIGSAAWSTTTYTNDTLTITLSTTTSNPTVALGDSITIGASCGSAGTGDDTTICDDQGINKAVGSLPNISGTFGDETTSVTSATASDASGMGPGIDSGDKVALQFSTPTNGFSVTSSNINTILPVTAKTWLNSLGNIQSAVWTNSFKTLTITLNGFDGTGPTIATSTDSVSVSGSCPNTICNASNSSIASGSQVIGGTFGATISPVWSVAPASNTGFQGGVIVRSVGVDKVYIGNNDGKLYVYDASNGANPLTYDATSAITSLLNVVDSNAYFVGTNRNLYAVQSNMTNLWAPVNLTIAGICDATFPATTSAPLLWTISSATRILLGCGKGVFARTQSDGTAFSNWPSTGGCGVIGCVDAGGQVSGTVSIASSGSDNYLYVATEAGDVKRIDVSNGTVGPSYSGIGTVKGSPFVRWGVLYIGGGNGTFYALNTGNMTVNWSYSGAGGAYESSPFYSSGKLYVGNNDGKLYCLTTGGSVCTGNWPFYAGSAITTMPVVYNNVVYFAAGTKLYAIDATTGDFKKSYNATYTIKVTPAIRPSLGMIFFGNNDAAAGTSTVYGFNLSAFQ